MHYCRVRVVLKKHAQEATVIPILFMMNSSFVDIAQNNNQLNLANI